MSAGIQVFNKGKTIQISNELTPLFLRKSGQIKKGASWIVDSTSRLPCRTRDAIDLSAYTCPFVFFTARHMNDRVCPMVWGDGNLFFYKWWNINIENDIQYYIFDMWQPPERSTKGLQVWNSVTKELIFDGLAWYPLQIKKIFNIPHDVPGTKWGTDYAYVVDTGLSENIAVGFSSYRSFTVASYSGGANANGIWGWMLRECAWSVGGTVYVSNNMSTADYTSWDGYVPTLNPYQYGSNLYVIDTSILPINYS